MPVGVRIPRKDFRDSKLKDTHLANLRHIESWSETVSTPVGMLAPYAGPTAPDGWLFCEGQTVKRAQYQGLFAVIGTTYGVGDGSTTFNVPDTRQRFVMGKAAAGIGATLGATGGDITHNHTIEQGNAISGGPSATKLVGGGSAESVAGPTHTHTDIEHNHSGTTGNANPPYIAVNYMIKV